jgi:[acyl-carrier-protein] S-malonyltransferase
MFFLGKETMTKRTKQRAGSWRSPLSWKAQGRHEPSVPLTHNGHVADIQKTDPDGHGAIHHAAVRPFSGVDIKARISTASFAFRGYDVTNLGKTPELLAHKAYGPVVRGYLDEASRIASDTLHRPFDLAARVEAREESTLKGFAEDIALIVSVELAQLACLEKFFGVEVKSARQTLGYSIGEMASMVAGGVFTMEQLLPVPLLCADDCAELAEDAQMGILFSRGPVLTVKDVQALCTTVSAEGKGIVGVSSYLSPNTALVMGQGDTLARLEAAIPSFYPEKVMLRRKTHKLPPLHTPLVWLRNIPNRAAVALYQIPGGLKAPTPPVVSCVTGAASYDALNARDLLIRWVDQPQLLWDAICETLSSGVDLLVHAGPAPNLIPATFERLSNNVTKQLGNRYFQMIGRGVGTQMHRHAWLGRILPSKAALLLAPHVTHVVLEDWLLEHEVA